jgi:hypothetical protein
MPSRVLRADQKCFLEIKLRQRPWPGRTDRCPEHSPGFGDQHGRDVELGRAPRRLTRCRGRDCATVNAEAISLHLLENLSADGIGESAYRRRDAGRRPWSEPEPTRRSALRVLTVTYNVHFKRCIKFSYITAFVKEPINAMNGRHKRFRLTSACGPSTLETCSFCRTTLRSSTACEGRTRLSPNVAEYADELSAAAQH